MLNYYNFYMLLILLLDNTSFFFFLISCGNKSPEKKKSQPHKFILLIWHEINTQHKYIRRATHLWLNYGFEIVELSPSGVEQCRKPTNKEGSKPLFYQQGYCSRVIKRSLKVTRCLVPGILRDLLGKHVQILTVSEASQETSTAVNSDIGRM